MTDEVRGSGRRAGRVVISSITGKPIPWDDETAAEGSGAGRARTAQRGDEPPLIPDRAGEDTPEAGERAGHDAQILRDVPPHWGTGA